MNKHFSLGMVAFGLAACLGFIASQAVPTFATPMRGSSGGEHTLTLDGNNFPSSLTSSYQNNIVGDVVTSNGNSVELSFVNAKQLNNGFAQLAPHGKMYNFATSNEQITGINGVSFTGSGSFTFKPAVSKGILADITPISVSAGSAKVTVPNCDFFEIEAGDSGASITSLSLSYSCSDLQTNVQSINGTYTGIGNDTYTYKLVLNSGTATLTSLDKATNTNLVGTVSLTGRTSAVLSFANMTVNLTFNGHALTYVSKTGSASSSYANISFDRVYTLENFESYSAQGQGYTSSTTKYQTTGLRAHFYADYYTGSGSGEIGGSGWPVMTSSDNSNYNSNKGHNSSKCGIFKFSNGTGMRYISMNELYGVPSVAGKGTKISFWARGAYTNTNFNTNHSSNTTMKFYAYYGTPLTPSNQASVRETFDYTVQSGSTWQHFEFDLNPSRTYYGFGFYAQQSSGSTQYVPFDDIQIYTASPYAEYVAPIAVTGVSVSPTALNLTTGSSSQLIATVSPSDATNKSISWSSNNTSKVTVDQDGTVHAIAAGSATVTVTTVDGGHTANCSVTVSEPNTHYPSGTYSTNISVLGSTWPLTISFGTESNGLIAVYLANTNAEATGVTYVQSTNKFTIATSGSYSGYSFGNVTGTYDYTNDRLTGVGCTGAVKSGISNNNNITVTKPTTSSTSYYNSMDGTTSQLQSEFKRRYMSGSWQVDTSNADRITSNTTEFVSGTGSLKRRGYGSGAVALNLNNDWTTSKTLKNIHFWVYNPSNSDISLRMWIYKAKSLGSNEEIGGVTAKAKQWTYCAMGFSSVSKIYNFQIADFNNTGQYLSFDNLYLFTSN